MKLAAIESAAPVQSITKSGWPRPRPGPDRHLNCWVRPTQSLAGKHQEGQAALPDVEGVRNRFLVPESEMI